VRRRCDFDDGSVCRKIIGLSVQFAGGGAASMKRAKARGLGGELPAFMFERA